MPKSPVSSLVSQPRTRHQRWLAAVALVAVFGCSVYDSSLIAQGDRLSGADGGQSDEGGDAGMPALPVGGTSDDVQAGSGGTSAGSVTSDSGTGASAGVAGGAGVAGSGGAPAGGTAGAGGTTSAGNGGSAGASGSGGNGGAPVLQELAVGKSATASTQQTGHEAAKGNDKDLASRWCAVDGQYPQWWRVDLGAAHPLSQVVIRFEHPDRTYGYVIETSNDDKVYTQQRTASGTSAVQSLDLPADVKARYVRITITSGLPVSVNGNGTWASFFDFSVQGY